MTEEPANTKVSPDPSARMERRLRQILNDASLALMISIGHRVGLFDTLAGLPPSISERIAEAAGLHPRYVLEWLRAMTVGGIVRYDPETDRYELLPEAAAHLTRAAGPDNVALRLQLIPVLAGVEDRILECFRNGGGLAYGAYSRFHQIQHEGAVAAVDDLLVQVHLPLAGLTAALERGIDVLDVGCGAGRAVNVMARAFPRSRFTGIDIAEEALAIGRREAAGWSLDNVEFLRRDAARMEEAGRWDLITAFDVIHDQADPHGVAGNVFRALRPQGIFLMVEKRGSSRLEENLDHPLGPYLYSVSCLHCTSVSLAAGGPGLGTLWGREEARALLEEAGFHRVEVIEPPDDETTDLWMARRA